MNQKKKSVLDAVLAEYERITTVTGRMSFARPVVYVYKPLEYAKKAHEVYIRNYMPQRPRVVFMGMNPGPFGMAQTGVPFGEIHHVREWLKISDGVEKPATVHPKKPVLGFDCPRSEVSGRRLWGLFRDRFPHPADFFSDHFVINYCPLLFLSETGANLTPVQLGAADQKALKTVCDHSLQVLMSILKPGFVVGIGRYAAERAAAVLAGKAEIRIGGILHPSPANPQANRDWAGIVQKELFDQGIW